MKVGKLIIASSIILGFLQFPNGDIRFASVNERGDLELVIQDDEMSEIRECDSVPVINPRFISYQDCMGNKVAIRQPL